MRHRFEIEIDNNDEDMEYSTVNDIQNSSNLVFYILNAVRNRFDSDEMKCVVVYVVKTK